MAQTIDRAEAAVPKQAGGTGRERSPEQIEADIERTRAQLAGTIDDIADRVSPKRVAERGVGRLRERAGQLKERALQYKGQLVDGDGKPRKVPVLVAAVGVTALVAAGVWRRHH